MQLHIINLFYNFVVYNLIVCNLFGNILKYCYSYSVIDAEGLHFHCTQFNCIQSNWRCTNRIYKYRKINAEGIKR